jgi:MFS family permease
MEASYAGELSRSAMLSFMDVVRVNQISILTATDDVLAQLIAIRLLIGVFEAGFYPTAIFYLSTFYTRFDLAVRIALFYGQYAIAGAFSGAICMYYSHS